MSMRITNGGNLYITLEQFRSYYEMIDSRCLREAILPTLLGTHADINETDYENMSLLMWACKIGVTETALQLIEKGCDVNTANLSNITALHWAARYGETDLCKALIDKGANVGVASESGWTPLIAASLNGHTAVVSLLLENGADVHETDSSGKHALQCACERGHVNIVTMLLDRGSLVNTACSDFRRTPLHRACIYGCPKVARLLIQAGADINAQDEYDITPLHYASYSKDGKDLVDYLLKNGADFTLTDESNRTPMMVASENNNVQVLKYFLKNNISFTTARPSPKGSSGKNGNDLTVSGGHNGRRGLFRSIGRVFTSLSCIKGSHILP